MEISILSRKEFTNMLAEHQNDELALLSTYNVISIFSHEGPVLSQVNPNLLSLDFEDIEPADSYGEGKFFDREQARQVIKFLESLNSQDKLIVHCHAGISRSGAIGTFAAKLSGQSVEDLHKCHPRVYPNSWVLNLLEECYKEEKQVRCNPAACHKDKQVICNPAACRLVLENQKSISIEAGGHPQVNEVDDIPESVLSLVIGDLDMDNRTKNILMRNKIRTVGQVRSMSPSALWKLKGMGEVSMQKLAEFLEKIGDLAIQTEVKNNQPSASSAQKKQSILLEIFLKWWEEQQDSGRAIRIMMKRWGGFGRKETLEEIGKKEHLTRERVRQLTLKYETKLRFRCGDLMRSKIQALFQDRNTPLYLEYIGQEDPWFSEFETLESDGVTDPFLFMGNMIEAILGDYFVFQLNDRKILCRRNESALNELSIQINEQLRDVAAHGLTLHATLEFVQERCEAAKVPELQSHVFDVLRAGLNFGCDDADKDVFLKSVGTNAVQTVIAVLQTAEKPLHFNEVTERCKIQYGKDFEARNVAHILQDTALLYNRGTYGLKKHFHLSLFDENRVREDLEGIIEMGNVERQWHCDELLSLLRQLKPEMANLCDLYTINIVLQESKLVRNLRRFVWVHASSKMFEASDRKLVGECAVEILRKAGRPLSNEDLMIALANERGIKTGMQIHPNQNLIRIDRGMWGLLERDIPLSEEQRNEMLDELYFALERHAEPIHISQAIEEIIHANLLSPQMITSLAQIDSRFRVDRAQNIHLNHLNTGASEICNIASVVSTKRHYGAA